VSETPPVEPFAAPEPDDELAPPVPPTPRARRRRRVVVEWVAVVAVALVASFVVRAYLFQTFYIPSGSMEPTLMIGDRIIVDKVAVELGTINRGDVVVFKAPPEVRVQCNDAVSDLVKRVIGLPGDHLTSRGNTVYVNGVALREAWHVVAPIGGPIGHVTVPAGHYFVMGDNRPNSCDSRMWGTVPQGNIVGKAFVRIWPLSRIGSI
jgi:signal peptidase I